MRNIKFRAYVKSKHNAMCRVESINFCGDNKYDVLIKTADLFKNPTATLEYLAGQSIGNTEIKLMQYTGLKDKNGVEIYEGDVVRYKDTHGEEQINTVEYNKQYGAFCFDRGAFVDTFNCAWEIEVIGNIYKNPELIGQYDGD